MRKVKVIVLTVLVLTLTSNTLLGRHQEQKKIHEYGADEPSVRHAATFMVMPIYPEEAIRAGAQGLFDAAVRFDNEGNFERIKVLESPHPAISKAVEEAVRQWKVRVSLTGDRLPYSLYGELRFHFIIGDERGRVENPSLEEQKNRSKAFIKITDEYLRNPRSRQQP